MRDVRPMHKTVGLCSCWESNRLARSHAVPCQRPNNRRSCTAIHSPLTCLQIASAIVASGAAPLARRRLSDQIAEGRDPQHTSGTPPRSRAPAERGARQVDSSSRGSGSAPARRRRLGGRHEIGQERILQPLACISYRRQQRLSFGFEVAATQVRNRRSSTSLSGGSREASAVSCMSSRRARRVLSKRPHGTRRSRDRN